MGLRSNRIHLARRFVNGVMDRRKGMAEPGSRRSNCLRRLFGLGVAIFAAGFPIVGTAGGCTAASSEYRMPVLELYTSEGCDSCPPADRWVSGLPARGLTTDRVVTLAFHVDYWNHLGWTD